MKRRIHSQPEAAPRIIKIKGSSLGIVTYDDDNGYPQRMDSLVNACSTAKQCVKLLRDYTVGQGFDPAKSSDFFKTVINRRGLTPDKLLRRLAADKAIYRGFCLHVNYNALYQIADVSYVPFETVRIGAYENEGKFVLNPNWYDTGNQGQYRRKTDNVVINRYNPDPEIIEQEVEAAGGWDSYKGQVLWHSDDFDAYPLSTIDPVLEPVKAEIESDKSTTNNLANNFQLKTIYVIKGEVENEKEREDEIREIQKFMGSEGKQVAVVESRDPEGKDVPDVIDVPAKVNDKLFQYTDEKVRAKIYRSFSQPAILHSDYLGTNGYNEGQLPQSMEYYNNYTNPERILFEEVFTEIFTKFADPINTSNNYQIRPLAMIQTKETGTNGDTTTNI